MDYLEGGCKPKKASGTRWIAHKLNAMKMILDKWGLYIVHLEHLSQGKSIKAKDCSKLIGYLNKWKQGGIPLMLAFFIDLLQIPSILSKCFQDEKIDPVYAMQCLNKADERFELFTQKKFDKLPHVEDLLKRVVEKDGEFFYQDVKLPGFEIAKNSLKNQKAFFTDKINKRTT